MHNASRHRGFSLLIFLVLLMGAGGIVLAGVTQKISRQVQAKRVADNTQVLQQAKQALLMYAYRYPRFNGDGPGRLPCPDDDNDGLVGALTLAKCTSVGRLPWDDPDLNFYDARDASGERLWYAVSDNFYNFNPGGASVVKSDTAGTITIVDQAGNIQYDGAAEGVAAVIIAPGPAINGQVRAGALTVAANYLETFNGFDNTVFNNGESDTNDDGFILGPVLDPAQNSVVINDQIIVITAAEVIAMAERAVLEIYREAILTYQANIGLPDYPWLFDYATDDLDTFTSPLTNIGRVPSIFSDYFTDADSAPIESELRLMVGKDFAVKDEIPPGNTHSVLLNLQSTGVANLSFSDAGTGRLSSDVAPGGTAESAIHFYKVGGNWQQCDPVPSAAGGGTLLSDCNHDPGGNPDPGRPTHDANIEVLKVGIRVDFTAAVDFDLDYANNPVFAYVPPSAAPNIHAEIQATFLPADVDVPPAEVFYEEADYLVGAVYAINNSDQQDLTDDGDFGDVENQTAQNVTIGMRYYPELPSWASSANNDWHDSILMAYALDFSPGGTATCNADAGDSTDDCLVINNMGGVNNDISALLVLAGEHGMADGDDLNDDGDYVDPNEVPPDNSFADELHDIFETENYSGISAYPVPNPDPAPATDTGFSLVFDKREDVVNARPDQLLIIAR